MSILVSGSIAFDTIMHVVENFREADHKSGSETMYLALYAHDFRRYDGGAGANIAYSLALLGKHPYLIGTYGDDGHEYIERLAGYGIDTSLCAHIRGKYCANACIIRDTAEGQINTFHMGALAEAGLYSHRVKTDITHAIAGPDAHDAMLRRVEECVEDGIFTIFDPGQAMGILSRDELLRSTELADLTIMNEAEREQYTAITGKDFVDVARSAGKKSTLTLGEDGSTVFDGDREAHISAIPAEVVVDATGCGDSYRAGLLYGLSEGWILERSAKLGSVIASIKITHFGGQNHTLPHEKIDALAEKYFGETFFA